MSVNVGYFFNSGESLNELSQKINGWLGCNLTPYEGDEDDLFCIFLGMEMSFGVHYFDNDLDLNFKDYKYEIDLRIPAGNDALRGIQILTIAFIAKVLYERARYTGILVYDVQKLLARYVEKYNIETEKNDLFDLVTHKFVIFPQYCLDLTNPT